MEVFQHPSSKDDVTPRWLGDILEIPGIVGVDVEAAHDQPHLGSVWRARIQYKTKTKGPLSVVIKAGAAHSSQGEASAMFARTLALGRREVHFYNEIAHEKMDFVPKVFRAVDGKDLEVETIVMEDLTLRGCVGGNIGTGGEQQHVLSMMNLLGKVHGSFWGKVEEHEWLWNVCGSGVQAFFMGEFKVLLNKLLSSKELVSHMEKEEMETYERLYRIGNVFLERAMEGEPCLTHGDTRMDNVFFDEKQIAHVMVDWQFCMRGGPLAVATDVASFLCLNVDPALLEKWEEVVQVHYAALIKKGRMKLSFDQWKTYVVRACVWPLGLICQSGGRSVGDDSSFGKEAQRLFLIGRDRAWQTTKRMGFLKELDIMTREWLE